VKSRPTLQPPRNVPVGQARRTLEAVRMFRANFVFGALLLLLGLLLGRFAQLQLVHGAEYRARAEARHLGRLTVVGVRGRIVDARGRLLATSSFGREVAVDPDPRLLPAGEIEAFCQRLAGILDDGAVPGELRQRLEAARAERWVVEGPLGLRWMRTGLRHIVLRRYVAEPRVVAALDEATEGKGALPGLKVSCVERRAYPNGDYALEVIGLPLPEGAGSEAAQGVEGLLDRRLDAAQVSAAVCRDGRARCLADGALFDRELLAGREVRLTLDIVVQHHVEQALDRLLLDWKPSQAVAIVLDPHSGALLALANRAYDLKLDRRVSVQNLALRGLYEPGSVFKPFTVAWALRRGLPADTSVPMPLAHLFTGDSKPIHDTHYVGDGDVVLLISESSNTGAAWVSDWMTPQGMPELISWMELDQPTGIELPQELAWRRAKRPLQREDQLRTAYGQGLALTPLRLASAFSAFARADGRAVRPTLVPDTLSPCAPGEPLCAPEHLALVRRGLEGCVDTGTAEDYFRGCTYGVAGKTGTALITKYTQHVCSFVGYAPREAPRVVVLVMAVTERHQEGSGGSVAGPVACRILERTLPYLGSAPLPTSGAARLARAGQGK